MTEHQTPTTPKFLGLKDGDLLRVELRNKQQFLGNYIEEKTSGAHLCISSNKRALSFILIHEITVFTVLRSHQDTEN